MDRLPNESDDAYFRRMVTIASSSQSFESAVLKQQQQQQQSSDHNTNSTQLTSSGNITTTPSTGGGATSKYVRAEVWDEQERQKQSTSGNWEERVQFDGQIHGNRYNQNEILRQNLKGF